MAKKVNILVHGKHPLSVSETKAKALVDGGQAIYVVPKMTKKKKKTVNKEATSKKETSTSEKKTSKEKKTEKS